MSARLPATLGCALLLSLAACLRATLASADTLSVAKVSVPRSTEEIVVPVSLQNSIDVGGFALHLTYDATRLVAVAAQPGDRAADFELFGANLTQPGEVIVTAIADFVGGATVAPLAPGAGSVVELHFAVADGAPEGLAPLLLVEGSLSNPSGTQYLQPALQNGWIRLTSEAPGTALDWGTLKARY